jgi:hypothetical protein
MQTVPRNETHDLSPREAYALADALEEVRQRRTAKMLRTLLADVFGDGASEEEAAS